MLFCELGPTAYKISLKKEEIKRDIKNTFSKEKIAKKYSTDELEYIVKSHTSLLLRKLHGVDMQLQENKVTNIKLACEKINGIIIHPTRIDKELLRTVEGINKLIEQTKK